MEATPIEPEKDIHGLFTENETLQAEKRRAEEGLIININQIRNAFVEAADMLVQKLQPDVKYTYACTSTSKETTTMTFSFPILRQLYEYPRPQHKRLIVSEFAEKFKPLFKFSNAVIDGTDESPTITVTIGCEDYGRFFGLEQAGEIASGTGVAVEGALG